MEKYLKSWIIIDPEFTWQSDGHKRKYRPAKWNILCHPRDQGGLGIQDLKNKYDALLSEWLLKLLITTADSKQKYMGTKPLAQVEYKSGNSYVWGSLMKVKLLLFLNFHIKDGYQI